MSRSPLLLALTWLMTCAAVLTAGLVVGLAPVEITVAWPTTGAWQSAASITTPVALVLAVASGLLLFLLSGSAKEGNRTRPFAELLMFFPVLFALVWLLLPGGQPNTFSFIFGLVLLAVGGYLFRHSPGPITRKLWQRNTTSIFLDAVMILLPILAGFALGYSPDIKAGGLSLFLYPTYAFIQLGIFLYIPVTRLRAMGVSSQNSTLLAALVFSLIHWPNPLVMLVTLAGMLIWAHQFQSGRPLWQLALVMGLTATTFSQLLPDDLTHHMRVGPGYVRSEAISVLANDNSFQYPAEFIEFAYPQTIGRDVQPAEQQVFLKLVETATRSTWAYMFLNSPENRRREAQTIPPGVVHWSDWPDEMKNQINAFASDEYYLKCGKTPEGYLHSLYNDILGRQVTSNEIKPWLKSMSKEQRRKFSQVLLEQRASMGQDGFKGMDLEEFRYPN